MFGVFLGMRALMCVGGLLLLWLPVAQPCGRGSIIIKDNGYRQVLIAISEEVEENPRLIDRIKYVFTVTSSYLYNVTRNRAYLSEITILIPPSWSLTPDATTTREALDKSDVEVGRPDDQLGRQMTRPVTVRTAPCGQLGQFIQLTDRYLLDSSEAQIFGPYEKVLVHEWSHLRYGVFDEYPGAGSNSDHFYPSRSGAIEGTRCGTALRGHMYNKDSGQDSCQFNGQTPEGACRFRDEPLNGRYASLMYKPGLVHVDGFCDSASDDELNPDFHNAEAPSEQNRMCGGKSVWEVLREHPDFANGANPVRPGLDTAPKFKVVKTLKKRTVLVLDISGSMDQNNRLTRIGHGCSNFIHNIQRDGEQLGAVWFGSTAEARLSLTELTADNRRQVAQQAIPLATRGATSIGAGVLEGLQTLQRGGGTAGGAIILVTDGQENRPPYISNIVQQVQDSGITVHTIAFTDAADSQVDMLAEVTGGLSFLYSDSETSNALNEAFRSIGELNQGMYDRTYQLLSDAHTLLPLQVHEGLVALDASLGRHTQLVVDYSLNRTRASLVSPSGITYMDTSFIVRHDQVFLTYTFSIPGIAEPGEWRYRVVSEAGVEQRVAVGMTSRAAREGEPPVVARAFWGRRGLGAVVPGPEPHRQTIYASVSKDFAPVLQANVVATVERPNEKPVDVTLTDGGFGADATANDGIYSAFYTQITGKGRYNMKVQVNSSPVTVVSPRRIIGHGAAPPDEDSRQFQESGDRKVELLQRVESGGSFHVDTFVPGFRYAPARVSDLRVHDASRDQRTVTLQWTAVGGQLDYGIATWYELRMAPSVVDLLKHFDQQELVTDLMLEHNASLHHPAPAGTRETFVVKVTEIGNVTYAFGLRAVSGVGVGALSGALSNIAAVSMRDFPQVPALNVGMIVGVIVSCAAIVGIVVGVIVVVIVKKKQMKQVTPGDAELSERKSSFKSNTCKSPTTEDRSTAYQPTDLKVAPRDAKHSEKKSSRRSKKFKVHTTHDRSKVYKASNLNV